MLLEVNYSNPKEFLSTCGYDAPQLLLLVIREAHIVSHQGTCSTGCETIDKQICSIEQQR
uniref:Uncharacterized protein n=1 Tax=Octopus bimaculoides TaxID=37653 RepID=A0A0L8I1L9_OCTBM